MIRRLILNRFVDAAIIAALLGGLAGLFLPDGPQSALREAKAAVVFVRLGVHPGATNTLNCGWHGQCSTPPTRGTALDWNNSGNSSVSFRSWGYRSDGSTNEIGRGKIFDTTGFCYGVTVEVKDAFAFAKGQIGYTHSQTWTPNWDFTIRRNGVGWGAWTDIQVGFTSNPETYNCRTDPDGPGPLQPAWTGPHLHQVNVAGSWDVMTGYYFTPTCFQGEYCANPPGDDGEGRTYSYYLTGGYEQYRQQWFWNW